MKNYKLLPASIIMLAISIILSSLLIAQSLNNVADSISADSQQSDILGFDEAAEYLNISESDFLLLIKDKTTGINYIKINGKYVFSKEGLNKWIQSSRL